MQKLIIAGLKLPPLYSQEDVEDPMVRAKFFALGSDASWYLTEYSEKAPDGTPKLGFGIADLGCGDFELGYISVAELESLRYMGIPRVERDKYFTPMKLSELRAKLEAGVQV